MRFYENAKVLLKEQDQFEVDINDFVAGKINPVKFKAIRVAHGVYEQRQENTYMIRIRCAAGGITPQQLKKVAELAESYGSGEVHFTTRQEVQVHEVLIENIMNVIRGLNTVDLSSRGGGGNTIRNILTSPTSGIEKDEAFDVDPYAIELTSRLIQEPDSWNLPRKFKINMSNSSKDDTFTQATCLGYVAKIKDGQKGFEVYTAGGMGARPMVGHQLFDFIPDTRVYHVARAMKLMFDKHGTRRSKYSNRIKFLWRKLEREEFTRLFLEEYDKLKDDDSLNLELPESINAANTPSSPVEIVSSEDFTTWKKRYVKEQKQEGLYSVKLPLHLGDLLRNDADILCDFLDQLGDNTIRCDRAQNMQLRNIPEAYLGNLFNLITSMKMTLADLPAFLGNMINCTGAQTCKLGICLPRGLVNAIHERLINSDLDLDTISDLRVNMSGCPNTCGMHHIADLGFFGKIGRKEGEIYPAYNVLAGAKTGAGSTEYAKKEGDLPSHKVPDFVHDFLKVYSQERDEYGSYQEFLDGEGRDLIHELCESYKDVPAMKDDATFYTDFGATKKLSLDELGTAECSAGMFDMIDVDKKEILKLSKEMESGDLSAEDGVYGIAFHASRMLLVTRGLDSKTETQAFEMFGKQFIQAGIADEKFSDIVTLGKLGLKEELVKHKEKVFALSDHVKDLYKSMDDSLKFRPKTEEKDDVTSIVKKIEKDYRGVTCPMNFVKTKLALETMNSGEQLEIFLDDGEPIQNVPNSVKLEGHSILSQEKDAKGHWVVLIQKK
jgi:sulfite reductase (ferredoxin)